VCFLSCGVHPLTFSVCTAAILFACAFAVPISDGDNDPVVAMFSEGAHSKLHEETEPEDIDLSDSVRTSEGPDEIRETIQVASGEIYTLNMVDGCPCADDQIHKGRSTHKASLTQCLDDCASNPSKCKGIFYSFDPANKKCWDSAGLDVFSHSTSSSFCPGNTAPICLEYVPCPAPCAQHQPPRKCKTKRSWCEFANHAQCHDPKFLAVWGASGSGAHLMCQWNGNSCETKTTFCEFASEGQCHDPSFNALWARQTPANKVCEWTGPIKGKCRTKPTLCEFANEAQCKSPHYNAVWGIRGTAANKMCRWNGRKCETKPTFCEHANIHQCHDPRYNAVWANAGTGANRMCRWS